MTMLSFMSHGTQDMYPTLLKGIGFARDAAHRRTDAKGGATGIGAVLGPTLVLRPLLGPRQ